MHLRVCPILVAGVGLLAGLGYASAEPATEFVGPPMEAADPAAGPLGTPLGTGFTYQGQVKKGGTPCPGPCDFQFSLWDAAVGGTQLGATQTVLGVPVTNGLFTVELNGGNEFTANAFNADARWLQIAVRSPAGNGSYQLLSPRQKLAATPYAHYARSATTSAGLTLPFSADVSAGTTAFSVTNSGTWGAGAFTVNGSANPGAALMAGTSSDTGPALHAWTNGRASAGVFDINNAGSGGGTGRWLIHD